MRCANCSNDGLCSPWVCDDAGSQAPDELALCTACLPHLDGKTVKVTHHSMVRVLGKLRRRTFVPIAVVDRAWPHHVYSRPWAVAIASTMLYPVSMGVDIEAVMANVPNNPTIQDELEAAWRIGCSPLDIVSLLGNYGYVKGLNVYD